jgi:hypothetical protein
LKATAFSRSGFWQFFSSVMLSDDNQGEEHHEKDKYYKYKCEEIKEKYKMTQMVNGKYGQL